MNLNQKREEFLNKFQVAYDKGGKLSDLQNPGFVNKIKKVLLYPRIYIPYWIAKKFNLNFRNKKEVTLFYGRKITLSYNNEFHAIGIVNFGIIFEAGLTRFFIKHFNETDVFYDIGANYGFYTYLATEFCREIHSFEPLPHIFKNMESNLSGDANVFLNNVALGDREDVLKMHTRLWDSGGSTISSQKVVLEKFDKTIDVKMVTLDNYVKTHNPPTIIKMDVEGAESLVIEGGENFLSDHSPMIIMEVWDGEGYWDISKVAVEKLNALGYQPYRIADDGEMVEVGRDYFKAGFHDGSNYVFIKNRHAS